MMRAGVGVSAEISQSRDKEQKRGWDVITSLTVAAAAILCLAFALLTPPFQFNDEHGHFARAYQISRGQLIGRPDPLLPASVLSTFRRYPERFGNARIPATSLTDLVGRPAGESDTLLSVETDAEHTYLRWDILAYQLYCPFAYLPAGIGIVLSSNLGLSPVGSLYAARVMNVFFFVAALAFAFFLAPSHRALFAVIALMPMTLQQAAAVSSDGVTIALSLVGFALLLRARAGSVSRLFLAGLFLFVPLWVMCKNSVWALPLLLLIPQDRFGGRRRKVLYLLTTVIVTVALLLGWRAITAGAFEQFRLAGFARGIDMYRNAGLLVHNPVGVLWQLVSHRILGQFVGAVGWSLIPLPGHYLYLALVSLVAIIEADPKPFRMAERAILAFAFAAALLQTYLMLFVIDGLYKDGHYFFWSAGVQGRYLIPFCLAGLLLLSQNLIAKSSRQLQPLVLSASTLYAVLSLFVMVRYYM